MKKKTIALFLASLLLSGCRADMSDPLGQPESESSDNTTGNSASVLNREENFDLKCKRVFEQLSQNNSDFFKPEFDEASIQYQKGEIYLSKIYNLTPVDLNSGDKIGDVAAVAFLNVYSESEDEIFQTAIDFITFVEEKAPEISESSDFSVYIFFNDSERFDINITGGANDFGIVYSDKNVRSAYSEKFKAVPRFENCAEGVAFSGIIKYDAVSELYAPFDFSCDYEGKTLSHKWYKAEAPDGGFFFVTYIDDGSYDDMSDEELIYYAYKASRDPANYSEEEGSARNFYYFAYKSGYEMACVIACSLSNNSDKQNTCTWYGDYSRLSSNPLNLELLSGLFASFE